MRGLTVAAFLFCTYAYSQDALTARDIYLANRDSAVQIYVGGKFSGNGFVVSPEGLVLTANHVVSQEPDFRKYAHDIQIKTLVADRPEIYPATIITPENSEGRVPYDYCFLQINIKRRFSYVTLGNWSESDIGDSMILIPSFEKAFNTAMLIATASMKGTFTGLDGTKLVNTIMFQAPVRKGFSGSPLFSMKGHVIGIVNTEIFGISKDLNTERDNWRATQDPKAPIQTTVTIGNGNIGASILGLINNLDANLISGLGTAVAIDYAKADMPSKQK